MSSSITKRQHYVWRAYLGAWAEKNQIYCLRDGKVFPSNLMGVAQERYFYRLHELNAKERDLIRKFAIQDSIGALKECNEQWLQKFMLVFDLKSKLQQQGLMNAEIEGMFNDAELQLEESLHSMIEGQSKKYIDMLLKKDISFYEYEESAMEFCFFFAIQYVRTPRMLENMKLNITDISGIDIAKVWSVSKIIVATNIAFAMFSKRSRYKLYILSSSNSRFITGDQPIINTHAVDLEKTPEDVEWFYPISPYLAVLISETERDKVSSISEEEVNLYNEMMRKSSYKQIYAAKKSDLEHFLNVT